ncbi:MAG TPA: hypothetical protein VM925_17695 [Labilithrix sp.]|nr:hypothetical protein [Labilithrix sp.]
MGAGIDGLADADDASRAGAVVEEVEVTDGSSGDDSSSIVSGGGSLTAVPLAPSVFSG